jgi:replicative DNA helicase
MNTNKNTNHHQKNAEIELLGAIMLEKGVIEKVYPGVLPEHFTIIFHRDIYNMIIELFKKQEPIDILTVTEGLRAAGQLEAIGSCYITYLTQMACSKTNIEENIKTIKLSKD